MTLLKDVVASEASGTERVKVSCIVIVGIRPPFWRYMSAWSPTFQLLFVNALQASAPAWVAAAHRTRRFRVTSRSRTREAGDRPEPGSRTGGSLSRGAAFICLEPPPAQIG